MFSKHTPKWIFILNWQAFYLRQNITVINLWNIIQIWKFINTSYAKKITWGEQSKICIYNTDFSFKMIFHLSLYRIHFHLSSLLHFVYENFCSTCTLLWLKCSLKHFCAPSHYLSVVYDNCWKFNVSHKIRFECRIKYNW